MELYLRQDVRVRGWIAWVCGRPVSAHADFAVLAALMAAEGLGEAARYTRAEDGAVESLPLWAEAGELTPGGVAAPDPLG